MEEIVVRKGNYCLSEEALYYIHGKLYKYYISDKKTYFYNGSQIVNDVYSNHRVILVRANAKCNINKQFIYSYTDLGGDEYCILLDMINSFPGFVTNQYGIDNLKNKLVIDAIKKLGTRAGDNGCIFEIINKQDYNFNEYYYTYEKQKAKDKQREERERRRFLIKNCESDRRCARELLRDFGIQLH